MLLAIADAVLDSAGLCFGLSLSSLRFIVGGQSVSGLPRQGASDLEPGGPVGPDIWQLAGPPGTSTPLTSFVHQQHLAQDSTENIVHWLDVHAPGVTCTAASLRAAVQAELDHGHGAMIAMEQSLGDGHVVIVYKIVDHDDGTGDYDLWTYDNNDPFAAAEDSRRAPRSGIAGNSAIGVKGSGSWAFNPSNFANDMFNITVIP